MSDLTEYVRYSHPLDLNQSEVADHIAELERRNAELTSELGRAKWQMWELAGVIADVEQGDGFDDVCLDTIKRVRAILAEITVDAVQPTATGAAKEK